MQTSSPARNADPYIHLLMELEALNAPSATNANADKAEKERVEQQRAQLIVKMDEFIQKSDAASFKTVLNMAAKSLPDTQVVILQSFVRHHIKPLTAEQFITQFQGLFPTLLELGLFSDFAQACELTLTPTPGNEPPLDRESKKDIKAKEAKAPDRTHQRIFKRVHHTGFLEGGIELQEREAKQNPSSLEVPADPAPLVQQWVNFVNQVSEWSKQRMEAIRQAEQKQAADAQRQMSKVSKKQASLPENKQAVQQDPIQPNVQQVGQQESPPETAKQKLTKKLKQNVKSLANRQNEHSAELLKIQDAVAIENWVRIFNVFCTKVNFGNETLSILFREIKDRNIACSFFAELLNNKEIRKSDQAQKRKDVIRCFFDINKTLLADPEWLRMLFSKLSKIQFYSTESPQYLFTLIDEILEISGITPENLLKALIPILIDALDKFDVLHKHRYSFLFALDVARHLIDKHEINPHQIKLANGKSFFEAVILEWQKLQDPRLFQQPDKYVPHHFHHEDGNMHSLYQVKVELQSNQATLTHCLLWCELLPLLSDEDLFCQHVKDLFPKDINDGEIKGIRQRLINSDGFELTPRDLATLEKAVQHKLEILGIDINAKEFDLFQTILLLLNKQKITIFKNEFDKDRHQRVLIKSAQVVAENEDGQGGGIGLLHEDGRNYLLIPIQKIIKTQRIRDNLKQKGANPRVALEKMRYILDGFVRKLFNLADFRDNEISEHLRCIPEMLCHLTPHLRSQLIDHIFEESLPEQKNPELPRESKQVKASPASVPDQTKANVFFRMMNMFQPDSKDESMVEAYKGVKKQIIEKYADSYGDNAYFQLFANNISPVFYESFDSLAQAFILNQIKNPHLLELYKDHQPNRVESQFDLVRLLDIPRGKINSNLKNHLLNQPLLACLAKLKSHPVNQDNKENIYKILRDLIIKFDTREPNVSLFNKLLGQLTDIFIRLNGDQNNLAIYEQIIGIIKAEDFEKKLAEYHEQIKKEYPLLEDVGASKEQLAELGPVGILDLIQKLNRSKLTPHLTDEKNQPVLQQILEVAGKEAKLQNDEKSGEIIPALRQGQINFNERIKPSNQTWLESAWDKKQLRNVRQLIEAGADVAATSPISGKAFFSIFLEQLTRQPDLLRTPSYQSILYASVHQNPQLFTAWVSAQPQACAACITLITNPEVLQQIALHALHINRFDLFSMASVQFRNCQRQPLGLTKGQLNPQFDAAFRKAFNIPPEAHYQKYINFTGFDTAFFLFPPYFAKAHESRFLEMCLDLGFKTRNREMCTPESIRAYFESLKKLHERYKDSWIGGGHSNNLYHLIMQAFNSKADKLSLGTIATIAESLISVNLPDSYPSGKIEVEIAKIFTQDPATWEEAVSKLHGSLDAFKKAARDPKKVMAEFKKCNPSIDDVIEGPLLATKTEYKMVLQFPFIQKVDVTPRQSPIEYFFGVFTEVTAMMTRERKGTPQELQRWTCEAYHNSAFGQWDPVQDRNFMEAICYATSVTTGKVPFHAQFVVAMSTCYGVPQVKKFLIEVGSGGGKTSIFPNEALGLLKIFPNTSFMPILTLTDDLATSNFEENQSLFDFFKVKSTNDVYDDKAVVRYTTSSELVRKVRRDMVQRKLDGSTEPLDTTHWIGGWDESDVDVLFRKGQPTNLLGHAVKGVKDVEQEIWNKYRDKELKEQKDFDAALAEIKKTQAYLKLLPIAQRYVDRYFTTFYQNARKIFTQGRAAKTDKTGAVEKEEKSTGLVTQNTFYHFETQFIQMQAKEAEEPGRLDSKDQLNTTVTDFLVVDFSMSYDSLLNMFPRQFGHSGTLTSGSQREAEILSESGYRTAQSARFTKPNITKRPTRVFKTKQEWHDWLVTEAARYTQKGRPAVMYATARETVDELYTLCQTNHGQKAIQGCHKVNKFKGDEKDHEEYETLRKEATYSTVDSANLTVAGIVRGRGVDMPFHNGTVNKLGGVGIIQAQPAPNKSTDWQVYFRTGRGECNGEVSAGYLEEDVRNLCKEAGMNPPVIDESNVDKLLEEAWGKLLAKELQSAQTRTLPERLTLDFFTKSKVTGKDNYETFVMDHLQKAIDATPVQEETVWKEYKAVH